MPDAGFLLTSLLSHLKRNNSQRSCAKKGDFPSLQVRHWQCIDSTLWMKPNKARFGTILRTTVVVVHLSAVAIDEMLSNYLIPQVLEGYLEAWLTHRELQNGSKRFWQEFGFRLRFNQIWASFMANYKKMPCTTRKKTDWANICKRLQANFQKVEPKLAWLHHVTQSVTASVWLLALLAVQTHPSSPASFWVAFFDVPAFSVYIEYLGLIRLKSHGSETPVPQHRSRRSWRIYGKKFREAEAQYSFSSKAFSSICFLTEHASAHLCHSRTPYLPKFLIQKKLTVDFNTIEGEITWDHVNHAWKWRNPEKCPKSPSHYPVTPICLNWSICSSYRAMAPMLRLGESAGISGRRGVESYLEKEVFTSLHTCNLPY